VGREGGRERGREGTVCGEARKKECRLPREGGQEGEREGEREGGMVMQMN